MASVYLKQGKYWLRYWNPEKGRWCDKPTPLHHPHDARKARQLRNETTAAEGKHRAHHLRQEERWGAWVPAYIRSRYGASKTYERYANAWSHLEGFLEEKRIAGPAAWKSEHNAAYVDWKESQGYEREPAIWDLGALAMVMNEAVRRDFITKHKVSKSRIKRGQVAEKPALTNSQIALIRKKLRERTQWGNLSAAFEIALHTGCRLAETSIPFDRINFDRETITFLPKGGRERMFTVPMLFQPFVVWLRELCNARRKKGHLTTCDVAKTSSRDFGRLCRSMKLKGPRGEKVTFHCLRVTFVSRAFEAGLSGEIVRKLVNHADVIVNRLYQRFSIEGLQALGAKLNLPVVSFPAPLKTSSAKPKPLNKEVSRRPGEDRQPSIGKASGKNSRGQRQAP